MQDFIIYVSKLIKSLQQAIYNNHKGIFELLGGHFCYFLAYFYFPDYLIQHRILRKKYKVYKPSYCYKVWYIIIFLSTSICTYFLTFKTLITKSKVFKPKKYDISQLIHVSIHFACRLF